VTKSEGQTALVESTGGVTGRISATHAAQTRRTRRCIEASCYNKKIIQSSAGLRTLAARPIVPTAADTT